MYARKSLLCMHVEVSHAVDIFFLSVENIAHCALVIILTPVCKSETERGQERLRRIDKQGSQLALEIRILYKYFSGHCILWSSYLAA